MNDMIFDCRGTAISLDKTRIMGILNCTPDSFSDGGKYMDSEAAVIRGREMIMQGADIIDIGGQSTRPGYETISAEEEWLRIEDVVMALSDEAVVSVDTFYPEVAKLALDAGAKIINDISGFGEEMMRTVAESGCGCIVMHNKAFESGTEETVESEDILQELKNFFLKKVIQAEKWGIDEGRLCFDPGIGFGKSYQDNLRLIANVDKTRLPGIAYLMAASRKRVIGKASGSSDFDKRMPGTIAAHTIAAMKGANILRVHDVKEAVQAAKVTDVLLQNIGRGHDLG